MPGSQMKPRGRMVFDGVELPSRAGAKRSREDASPVPSSSRQPDCAPRKRAKMSMNSGSVAGSLPVS